MHGPIQKNFRKNKKNLTTDCAGFGGGGGGADLGNGGGGGEGEGGESKGDATECVSGVVPDLVGIRLADDDHDEEIEAGVVADAGACGGVL